LPATTSLPCSFEDGVDRVRGGAVTPKDRRSLEDYVGRLVAALTSVSGSFRYRYDWSLNE